jgi:hypothetical protein
LCETDTPALLSTICLTSEIAIVARAFSLQGGPWADRVREMFHAE